MDIIGLDKAVETIAQALSQNVDKLSPLLQDVENRAGGILHGILDRLDGTTIEIKINIPPVPKAIAVDNAGQS